MPSFKSRQPGIAVTATMLVAGVVLALTAVMVPVVNQFQKQNFDDRSQAGSDAVDNCCQVNRTCTTDQQWVDGYFAYQSDNTCGQGSNQQNMQTNQQVVSNSQGNVCAVGSASGCQGQSFGSTIVVGNQCLECFKNSADNRCGRDVVDNSRCPALSGNQTQQQTAGVSQQQTTPADSTAATPVQNNNTCTTPACCTYWCGGCGGFCGDEGVAAGQTCNQQAQQRCGDQPCYVTGTCETCDVDQNGQTRCSGTTLQRCNGQGWLTEQTNSAQCAPNQIVTVSENLTTQIKQQQIEQQDKNFDEGIKEYKDDLNQKSQEQDEIKEAIEKSLNMTVMDELIEYSNSGLAANLTQDVINMANTSLGVQSPKTAVCWSIYNGECVDGWSINQDNLSICKPGEQYSSKEICENYLKLELAQQSQYFDSGANNEPASAETHCLNVDSEKFNTQIPGSQRCRIEGPTTRAVQYQYYCPEPMIFDEVSDTCLMSLDISNRNPSSRTTRSRQPAGTDDSTRRTRQITCYRLKDEQCQPVTVSATLPVCRASDFAQLEDCQAAFLRSRSTQNTDRSGSGQDGSRVLDANQNSTAVNTRTTNVVRLVDSGILPNNPAGNFAEMIINLPTTTWQIAGQLVRSVIDSNQDSI